MFEFVYVYSYLRMVWPCGNRKGRISNEEQGQMDHDRFSYLYTGDTACDGGEEYAAGTGGTGAFRG